MPFAGLCGPAWGIAVLPRAAHHDPAPVEISLRDPGANRRSGR